MQDVIQAFATLISTVGFPVAIAAFLIIRMEKILDRLATAVELIKDCLDRYPPTRP